MGAYREEALKKALSDNTYADLTKKYFYILETMYRGLLPCQISGP